MTLILEVRDLEKAFGGVPVLRGVSFKLFAGQVVALAGENGAGKSTIFKIITGQLKPDSGEVLVDGSVLSKIDSKAAREAGIAIVPQELATFPDMRVYENLFIGREIKNSFGILNRPEMISKSQEMLSVFGLELDSRVKMGTLSTALAQIIEIIKATTWNARVILLDEPTSSIPEQEVAFLYSVIQKLKQQGVAMMYTTHRMAEIQELADTVIVMRDGQLVLDKPISDASEQVIITSMIGRNLDSLFPLKNTPSNDVALKVKDLTLSRDGHGVSLEVREGEILGLGGLVGAGRTEIVEAIFGVRKSFGGEIQVGAQINARNNPEKSIENGIAIVPEDRKGAGLVLSQTILENGALPHLKVFSSWGLIRRGKQKAVVGESMNSVALKSRGLEQSAGTLSGGNQQKVVIGRWLGHTTKVLLLDEPTRGVDVGARGEIYNIIHDLAASGLAVLLVSSDMPELIGLSNRVLVVRDGQFVGELNEQDLKEKDVQEKIFRFASGLETAKVA